MIGIKHHDHMAFSGKFWRTRRVGLCRLEAGRVRVREWSGNIDIYSLVSFVLSLVVLGAGVSQI